MFESLGHYNDSFALYEAITYDIAVKEYNHGNFIKSKVLLEKIGVNHDSEDLLEKLNILILFQGTWKTGSNAYYIYGWTIAIDSPHYDRVRTSYALTKDAALLWQSTIGFKPYYTIYSDEKGTCWIQAISDDPLSKPYSLTKYSDSVIDEIKH